jgi:aminopeptidase YwaD
MTHEEGKKLICAAGTEVRLNSQSRRIPSKACNVIARRGKNKIERIVITAHIDAKKGGPGAIDNATGVIILLLLADLLKDYSGSRMIEIAALNGEDHYAVPGQMDYISSNRDHFNEIILNINIDGAGYREGASAFSFFGLTDEIQAKADVVVAQSPGIVEGVQWPQGDHSIFIQNGCPAIAVSSQWFIENMENQSITHTSGDNSEIVDCGKVAGTARALERLLREISS